MPRGVPLNPIPVEVRFWRHVNKNGPIPKHRPELGQCWIWLGGKTSGGYGRFMIYCDWIGTGHHGKLIPAHRFLYETTVGKIPDGLEPDHLCNTPACVRPSHLEPVTHIENKRRAKKSHCPKGHPYSGKNLYVDPRGWRRCRTCLATSAKKQHQ